MADLHAEILSTTRALVIVVDSDGRVKLFNPACEQLSGYRFEELRDTLGWTNLIPEDEHERVFVAFEKLRAGGFPSTLSNHWKTKTGQRRLIEWSASAVTDDRGRVTSIIGTGIDVTEQDAAEHALREIQRRQETLLDCLPDAVWMKDAQGVFLEANAATAEHCGRDRSDLIGKTTSEIMPAAIAERWANQEREVMQARKPQHAQESRSVNGETRLYQTVLMPVFGQDGGVVGTAGVSSDVTEREFHLERRRASDARQREALVKEVHHRIKNNLQGAILLVQQLAYENPACAPILDSAVARLNAIASVHGLYGTVGDGNPRLAQFIQELVASLQIILPSDALHLAVRDDSIKTLVVASESVPLAMVLSELVTNAIKHSRKDTPSAAVQIEVMGGTDSAKIVIRNRSGLFPRSFNFDADIGLGVGLKLVKALLPPDGISLTFGSGGDDLAQVEVALSQPVLAVTAVA